MTTLTVCHLSQYVDVPCINRVEAMRPWAWLRGGVADFAKTWPWSLSYGLVVAIASFLLFTSGWVRPPLTMTLTTGYLLVGPFLAIGFYVLSQREERERQDSQVPALFSTVRRNLASIGMFGVLLAFILSVWERVSAILVGLYLSTSRVPESNLEFLLTSDHFGFLLLYGAFALLLGLVVFALGVVSLPMLMDRKVDIVTALVTSLWVVRENPGTMLVWASCIVGLTAVAALTWFVALAVVFPVLGHATWHAYRDLVAG